MNPLHTTKLYLKICLLAILPLSCFAQKSQDTLRLTLEDAISIALKNSLEIQVAKNNVEANSILNNYGVAGGLPVVSGNISNTEQITNVNQQLNNGTEINRNGATGNNTAANLNAGILLYNGRRVVATKKRLGELEMQSKELLNSQIQNTMALVMTSYYDVVRQQSYLQTVQTSIEASQKRLEILEVRKIAGMANNADIFQAQIDLNTLNQTLLDQQLVANVAKTELLKLLTLDPASKISIQDTIVVDRRVPLESILDKVNENADVKAAENQIRINELIAKETNALRYPTIRLNLAYNYTRNQSGAGFTLLNRVVGPSAGVTMAVPIYNGSSFKRQKQVADINTVNARIRKDIVVRDYNASIVQMYETYMSSIDQLAIQMDNHKLSQQLLDLTLKRFELIQATIIDVREAQRSFQDSGYRLTNLNYAAKAAEIELRRLTNTLQ